jgi:glucose dehydrogenase
MKSPITHRKQTASFRIVGLMLTIAPLWLTLAAANTSARAQSSDDVSNPTAATTASSPADWTEFHRDNMERRNPYETVLGVNSVGSLQLKWKNPIGAYTGGFGFHSSPAVVNGVIYFGSDDGNVYALNASTGARLWSVATGSEVRSSPAVANGVVYTASSGAMLIPPCRVCTERQHRRTALELFNRPECGFLARSSEWGGLYRVRRPH